jgi:hypothetical protein
MLIVRRRPKKTTRRRKDEESESERSSSGSDGGDEEDEGGDQEMMSEPDRVDSGPPNTDTEEEVDTDKEPRRRSARTAAKVSCAFDVYLWISGPWLTPRCLGTEKAAITQVKTHEGLIWMISAIETIYSSYSHIYLGYPHCVSSHCLSLLCFR